MTVSRTDACQSVNARTANKVHQESFYSIITMVSNTNLLRTNILSELLEILVSQLAGSHFYANLM